MSWREGFNKALKQAVWDNGYPVRVTTENYSLYYMWADYELVDHQRTCPLGKASDPEEDEWTEFQGTFDEGSDIEYGCRMVASCQCGKIKDRTIRWHATIGDAIREVVDGP